jgi:3-phosphoshikimate 1-carboxyvinyltransferase
MVASAAVHRAGKAGRIRGKIRLPGDKSVSHRLAILAALAEGSSRFANFAAGADCRSTLRCLAELGVRIDASAGSVTVTGAGPSGLRAPARALDAGNSGSTMRMLAGVLAGRPFRSVLDGDTSLRARPMERVAAPLRAMGARVETTDGRPPVVIHGGPLTGIALRAGTPSAQVKTAVLLAGLQAEGPTTVIEAAATRDHTERLLPCFGVRVRREGLSTAVDGRATLTPFDLDVPGDVSSAAFFVLAALLVPDSRLRIEGVLLNPTRTAFMDVLRRMGGAVRTGVEGEGPEPAGWIEAETSRLAGADIAPAEVPALIDELPALAVAMACAAGPSRVAGAGELREKETDRIAALAEGLRAMGAVVEEGGDGYAIDGGRPLHGARVQSRGDHRIAMALAVAALAAEGETAIDGADCVEVSFPGFFDALARLAR